MKKYFALLNKGTFLYIGEHECYSDAYDYMEYEVNIPFLWIYKEENMHKLASEIDKALRELNEYVAKATD